MVLKELRWEYSIQGMTEGRIKEEYSSAHPIPPLPLLPLCKSRKTNNTIICSVSSLFGIPNFQSKLSKQGVQQILGSEGLSTSLPETPLRG